MNTPARVTEHGGTSGGVALLSRAKMQEPQLPSSLEGYVKEGRLAIGITSLPTLSMPVVVACFYGYPGKHPEKVATAAALGEISKFLWSFPHHHAILTGDFNLDPDEGYALHLLAETRWTDAIRLMSEEEPRKTCFNQGQEPTRIDHIWISKSPLGVIQDAGNVVDALSHPHEPVVCSFSQDSRPGLQSMFPPPWAPYECDREKRDQWLRIQEPRWNELLSACYDEHDMDAALITLSRKWEQYYRETSGRSAQGGRGKLAEREMQFQVRRLSRQQSWASRIRLLLGRLKALQKAVTQEHDELATNIERKIQQSLRLPPLDDLASRFSSDVDLGSRIFAAQGLWEQARKDDKLMRRRVWIEKTEAPNLKHICRCLKKPLDKPLVMVCEEGKMPTADPYQVAEELRSAWKQHHEPAEVEPVNLRDLHEFTSRLVAHPYELPPITQEQVQDAISKLKSATAAGADGWRAHETKMLPSSFSLDLVRFYTELEKTAEWPKALTTAWLTPVPKKTRKVADTRPIAIMGIVYRVWSSIRSSHLREWQEQFLPACQAAYRRGRDVEIEAMKFDRFLEKHQGTKVLAVALDLTKAYDSVDHRVLCHLWECCGLARSSVRVLRNATMRQTKRWRVASRFLGSAFQGSVGIPQGCSVSVSSFNIYMAPLAAALQQEAPRGHVSCYADDLIVAATSSSELNIMLRLIERYTTLVGLKLNPSKCVYAVTGKKSSQCPASVTLAHSELTPASTLDVLGVTIPMTKTPFDMEERTRERHIEAERRSTVLQSQPANWQIKARAASAAILPLYNYGAWRGKHTKQKRTHVRARMVSAVHGNVGRGPRAPEILSAFFSPIHTSDPLGAYAWKMLRLWYTHLCLEDGVREHLSEALTQNLGRKKGPFLSVVKLFQTLGVTWDPTSDAFFVQEQEIALFGHAWNEKLKHQWRDVLRNKLVDDIKKRRRDLCDLNTIDRKALHRQQTSLPAHEAAVLRTIQCGGVSTPDRISRQSENKRTACRCGMGYACAYHIFWECPLVSKVRMFASPVGLTVAEAECAIPCVGKSKAQQDCLAKHTVRTMLAWKKAVVQDDDTREDEIDDPPPPPACPPNQGQGLDYQIREPASNAGHIWTPHPVCDGFDLSQDKTRVRCQRCHASCNANMIKRHISRHKNCTAVPRLSDFGATPAPLPSHLQWHVESGVRRLWCLRCGSQALYKSRAAFVLRHSSCMNTTYGEPELPTPFPSKS